MNYLTWLFDPARWVGPDAELPSRILEHLGYTALTMVISIAVAVPIGAWIGHTGRGGGIVVGLGNGLRALPTLGLLILLTLPFGISLTGPLIALIVLAVPAVLAGTYAGVRNVEPSVVDAAIGMGMRSTTVLFRVELPNALPLIIGGIRSAVLQVVATATIAAYVGLNGLGRLIFDGLAQHDFPQMIAGAVLVAVLAIIADLALAGIQRLIVSPGLRATPRTVARAARPRGTAARPSGSAVEAA
ncbi:MAG: ABC transporter permease [Pseudonocardia sp.]|nr:ABC transporter permease [Pseudonocardia sp.]